MENLFTQIVALSRKLKVARASRSGDKGPALRYSGKGVDENGFPYKKGR